MTDPDTVITCQNVWKVFGKHEDRIAASLNSNTTVEELREKGFITAVRNVSLSIRRGEMLVVMGLSGSGKSTLVRCLARLIDVTSGAVMIEGRDIGAMSEVELIALRRRKMGMVFQSFGLLPHRTALENVAFPLEMRGQDRASRTARATEMLALVGLKGREGYFPRELSGGQQQRVGIARSLAVEPDIWFLDEPFSALDPLIRREMQDEFLRLKAMVQKTIVFITHDFDEAIRLADRIAIMKDGAVVQAGSPEDIVLHPATDYVRAFAGAVAKAKVVRVASVMEPGSADGPPLDAGMKVADAAPQFLAGADALPVVADGRQVGVLTRATVIRMMLAG